MMFEFLYTPPGMNKKLDLSHVQLIVIFSKAWCNVIVMCRSGTQLSQWISVSQEKDPHWKGMKLYYTIDIEMEKRAITTLYR